MQDVFANVLSKEVSAKTEVDYPFPQRVIPRARGITARELERRLVGPAREMATKTATDRMIGVTQGVLTPVRKPVDCNAHHSQSAFVRGGEHNFFPGLTAHIKVVSACRRRFRQCNQNRLVDS